MLEASYREGYLKEPEVPLAEILVLCGFLMIYLIEEIAHTLLHKFRSTDMTNGETSTGQSEELPTNVLSNIQEASFQIALRGFFIMLAISLHAVFEGIAMGLGTKASFVWYLCFAVAVHKFIIAFCIGLQMTTSGMKRKLIYAYMTTFSLVTPIGIAIGITLIETTTKTSSHGSSASAA